MRIYKLGLVFFLISTIAYSQDKPLKEHILFYSSFDDNMNADMAVGDPLIYTAENYKNINNAKSGIHDPMVIIAENKGFTGNALHFKGKKSSVIYFSGHQNLGYSSESWSGSFSFWLQVDPATDLAPGYCDPICLTDSKFNDAALWVDFTDDSPRRFRFGAMGDLDVWNPDNKSGEAEVEKRVVNVTQPPFACRKWTHIVITYSEINTNRSECKLYLDGELKGLVKDVNDPFTWEAENAKIMLGLGYIGLMDEITVFDKPLTLDEVKNVYALKDGIKALFSNRSQD